MPNIVIKITDEMKAELLATPHDNTESNHSIYLRTLSAGIQALGDNPVTEGYPVQSQKNTGQFTGLYYP